MGGSARRRRAHDRGGREHRRRTPPRAHARRGVPRAAPHGRASERTPRVRDGLKASGEVAVVDVHRGSRPRPGRARLWSLCTSCLDLARRADPLGLAGSGRRERVAVADIVVAGSRLVSPRRAGSAVPRARRRLRARRTPRSQVTSGAQHGDQRSMRTRRSLALRRSPRTRRRSTRRPARGAASVTSGDDGTLRVHALDGRLRPPARECRSARTTSASGAWGRVLTPSLRAEHGVRAERPRCASRPSGQSRGHRTTRRSSSPDQPSRSRISGRSPRVARGVEPVRRRLLRHEALLTTFLLPSQIVSATSLASSNADESGGLVTCAPTQLLTPPRGWSGNIGRLRLGACATPASGSPSRAERRKPGLSGVVVEQQPERGLTICPRAEIGLVASALLERTPGVRTQTVRSNGCAWSSPAARSATPAA